MANPLDGPIGIGSIIALTSGETVLPDGSFAVVSPSGNFRLQFQTDGNLVLLQEPGSAVIWASNTNGLGVTSLTMYADGFLEADNGVTSVWAVPTGPVIAGSRLVLQDDGNLVILSPTDVVTWSSGTGHDADAFPLYSTIPLPGHFIGEMTQMDGIVKVEIRGLGYVLQQSFVELFTPLCVADFGDARCKKDLAPFTDTGLISAIPLPGKVLTLELNTTNALGRYKNGLITFTSGENEGASVEVAGWTGGSSLTGNLALFTPVGAPLRIGDTFSIVPGCDKSFLSNEKGDGTQMGCYQWNNTDNFRGFPYIPGMQFLFDYGVQTG
jgi:uncharacterized phage protein (TIGR02218 family)